MIGKKMKDLAWNTFKQTGNINTFLEFKQIENIQNQAKNIEDTQYGNYQNEGDNPFRK